MNKQRRYTQTIPEFVPYKSIKVGNNKIGVRYILNISGFVPIIIGVGEIPQVWLFMKMNNTIIAIVEKNVVKTPQVKCYISNDEIRFSVLDIERNVWSVLINIKLTDKNEPHITLLDLRFIGISLFLDDNKLNIGKIVLDNTEISGVECLVGVD